MPRAKTTPTEPAEPSAAQIDLQREMARYGMFLVTMVVGTALWMPREYSERAFRLLHWWKREPEHTPEEDGLSGQRRARRPKGQ